MKARPNVVLLLTAVLVAGLAIAAWVLSATRHAPAPDLTTPEGTVQAYLIALNDSDDAAAVALLDPALGCEVPLPEGYWSQPLSASLLSSRIDGDRARVTVEIREAETLQMSSFEHAFDLIRKGQGWLLTGDIWPIYSCK